MNTFKRKALFTAIAALGAAGTAEAVFIAPNGTGQALVYPYYTVQNAGTNSWNTYISVVNTTPDAKAVKVRILEGRTSAEVLDFNLFLSANDVWTAAIVPVDATDGSAGRIITADNSCTAPEVGLDGETFRNFQYSSQAAGLGRGLDRTREGYIEIIEMASISGAFAAAVTHDDSGVPDDCDAVRITDYAAAFPGDIFPPTGGLMGTGTLINVNSGLDAGYKADALDAFSAVVNLTAPGATTPALAEVVPPSSIVFNSGFDPISSMNATLYRLDYLTGVTGSHALEGAQALASVFMHESIMNEYVLDDASDSLTDWVVTQPIKNFFVDTVTAAPPYTSVLTADGACEEVEFTFFDREERSQTPSGIDFSPPPPSGPSSAICWESTVMSIRNGADHMPDGDVSGVLGSRNTTAVTITESFQNGWARLRFTAEGASAIGLTSDVTSETVPLDPLVVGAPVAGPVTLFGLPVTGFMIRTFANGGLTCETGACQGNYASLFNHSYRNLILP